MKIYWDTSALIRFYRDQRISEIIGVTRPHSLTELFSALTGRGIDVRMKDGSLRHKRISMRGAAAIVKQVHSRLEYVDLTHEEIVAAIQSARTAGAQGGRIHDLMHAVAAAKAKADELWTLDQNDFAGLGSVPVKQL